MNRCEMEEGKVKEVTGGGGGGGTGRVGMQ